MKRISFAFLFIIIFGCTTGKKNKPGAGQLYQYGVVDGLLAGSFDGDLSIKGLLSNGDFGIGTFNRADGELIAFKGNVYQVKYDGSVVISIKDSTPFACVTKFVPDTSFIISEQVSYYSLQEILNSQLNSNTMYAIQLSGMFDSLTTRAVAPAHKPYPTLSELVATSQHLFHYNDLKGDCIGFLLPDYMSRINVPGYHFHFLSENHEKGGHVFAFKGSKIKVSLQQLGTVRVETNMNESFMNIRNRKDRSADLEEIE